MFDIHRHCSIALLSGDVSRHHPDNMDMDIFTYRRFNGRSCSIFWLFFVYIIQADIHTLITSDDSLCSTWIAFTLLCFERPLHHHYIKSTELPMHRYPVAAGKHEGLRSLPIQTHSTIEIVPTSTFAQMQSETIQKHYLQVHQIRPDLDPFHLRVSSRRHRDPLLLDSLS